MRLKRLELTGFKSFAQKTVFLFESKTVGIVGPNGSGKSNIAEAFRWVLGERSFKSLRGERGADLIFNGGQSAQKQSRAGVTLVFDNRDRYFSLDFDEVAITREVFRDGTGAYYLNGSPVRLRDISELLFRVALGSSEHFIISQGEADQLLLSRPSDRRAIVEDALGLQLHRWKIAESENKLEQTKNNLEKTASLRREISSHLRFLGQQVERIKRADQLRAELKTLYWEYFKREEDYLEHERASLKREQVAPTRDLGEVEKKLAHQTGADTPAEAESRKGLAGLVKERQKLEGDKSELSRRLGRLEGMIEARQEVAKERPVAEQNFSLTEVADFGQRLTGELERVESLTDIFSIKKALAGLKSLVTDFLNRGGKVREKTKPELDLANWQNEREEAVAELAKAEQKLAELEKKKVSLEQKLESALTSTLEAERAVFALKTKRSELQAQVAALGARAERLALAEADCQRELAEAKVLVDQEVMNYREVALTGGPEANRSAQEERRKKIERLKIKLEDLGVDSGDTLKEYRSVTERDAFLEKEITDLDEAAASLRQVMSELTEKIDQDFRLGLGKINHHFQDFFALMFGGGTASLKLVVENEENGLDININLPRKKVRGLEMLSGGERALVSIALLFAISQVNPPPFLILDETDAALDESNSRKYGEMVENLAQHSQLVLITHNRETMSRADLIYGVTMGADGISKLLSIKFDEATQFAK